MVLNFLSFISIFCAGILSLILFGVEQDRTADDGPSPAKTPIEQLATFEIEDGLKIQLVAAEPFVQDPVVIQFDEDGRLWVVEMRGFMPDIEGLGEKEPVGRISVLEDKDGDGQMDASTVYMDSLVMPRALALVHGGALVVENMALWLTRDLDGDLKADTKELIDPEYAGNALPEHSGNGLLRGLDNWYYNAKSSYRYRLIDNKWERDSTEFRGQWGISQDDLGRLYYNYNWSQLHADLVPPNYLSRNKNHKPTTGIDHGLTIDRRIYPIRSNPAVNRGYIPGTLDEQGRLREFTAACAPHYYRGKALSSEYYGSAFVCEPSGNLIKRNKVTQNGISLSAFDPHPGKEFLASTDERFRPVFLTSGPDGALYVADMYRGLVQHGAYISPYLKEQTLRRKLVLPVNRGRIWRIVPEDWTPSKLVKLSSYTSQQLVELLNHDDGWYRDMAQRLLVERNDATAKPQIIGVVKNGKNDFGRIQALWTLEGLNLLEPALLLSLLDDRNPNIRATALRLLEPFAKADNVVRKSLEQNLQKAWQNAPLAQVLQISLSSYVLDDKVSFPILRGILERYGSSALIRDAVMSSLGNKELAFLKDMLSSKSSSVDSPDNAIFFEMLATAIVRKGASNEFKELLAIIDDNIDKSTWQQNAILTGMSVMAGNSNRSPVQLDSKPKILSKNQDLNSSRLNAIYHLFEWPGHKVDKLSSTKIFNLTPEEQELFALGRQQYLSTCSGCHGNDGSGASRLGPPLINSDWVTGNATRLALIVLHGLEGPVEVNGKIYDAPEILPVMPAHYTLDDATIASILTYIRNEWTNDAGAVPRSLVGKTRLLNQGRVIPWKAEELKQYTSEEKMNEQ